VRSSFFSIRPAVDGSLRTSAGDLCEAEPVLGQSLPRSKIKSSRADLPVIGSLPCTMGAHRLRSGLSRLRSLTGSGKIR